MCSKRTAAVCGLLTILMTLSIACFPERAEAAGFPTAEAWLVIDTLYCKVSDARPGKDTFLLKGYFHWEPGSFDPAASDVTIAIDNHVITIPADQWKKQGTSKFKAKYANVSAQIDYWVKGSGRCNFIFVGTRQDMAPNVPNLPDMPVRIVVSPSVDITVFVSMKEFGRVWKMDEADSLPSFAIDKMQVKLNPKTASKDAYKVWGRVFLPRDFDP